MDSISSPGGPSISGYDQNTIDSEVSSTQATYNTALSRFNRRLTTYQTQSQIVTDAANAALDAWQTLQQDPTNQDYIDAYQAAEDDLNQSLSAYTSAKNRYLTAISGLQTAATDYVTALARQQMFSDTTSAQEILNVINGLSPDICPPNGVPPSGSFPTFPGITQAEVGEIAPDQQAARDQLLAKFNAYRYLEWQISDTRATILNQQVASLDALVAYAQNPSDDNLHQDWINSMSDINSSWNYLNNTLLPQRTSVRSNLTHAINDYKRDFGSTDPILAALDRITTFANNWDSTVASLEKAASDAYNAVYQGGAASDAAALVALRAEYPTGVTAAVSAQITAITASMTSLQETIQAQGASFQIEWPTLPNPSGTLSLSELMTIISQVQLKINELTQKAASVDVLMRMLNRELVALQVSMYTAQMDVQVAWDNAVKLANTNYNTQVAAQNLAEYQRVVTIYNIYKNNLSGVNAEIDQVNSEISAHNTRTQQLVDAANTINQDIYTAVTSAMSDRPNINYLDYQNLDPNVTASSFPHPTTVTAPPSIPSFPHVAATSLPDLPEYPVEGLTSDQVTSTNATIAAFLNQIAPFSDRVASYIKASDPSISPTQDLSISPFYQRTEIPVIDPNYVSPVVSRSTNLGFLLGYSGFLRRSKKLSKKQTALLLKSISFTGDIQEISSVVQTASIEKSSISPGVSFALAIANLLATTGDIGRAINMAMQSDLFQMAVVDSMEKIAVLAGIKIAGVLPEKMSQALMDKLEEAGIDIGKAVESNSTQALIEGVIEGTLGLVKSNDLLHQIVLEALQSLAGAAKLSQKDLQLLISMLVALLKTLLLLLAALLGVEGGINPGELVSTIMKSAQGTTASASESFQKMGIPTEKADHLAAVFGPRSGVLLNILKQLGFSDTTSTVLHALLSASAANISLARGVPGGAAFLYALYAKLKDVGIEPKYSITSKEFIKDLVAQITLHAENQIAELLRDEIRALEKSQAPKDILAPPAATTTEPSLEEIQKLIAEMQDEITKASTETPTTPATTLTPSDILNQFGSAFQKLPPPVQNALLAIVRTALPEPAGISDETKAGLILAVKTGIIQPSEAALLLDQVSHALSGSQISMASLESEIAKQLFRPTEEEIRLKEELQKAQVVLDEKNRPIYRPPTVLPDLRLQLKEAFKEISRSIGNEKIAKRIFEVFFQNIERLSSYNKVAVDFILAPSKTILRIFSLWSRTASDLKAGQNFPITLGG